MSDLPAGWVPLATRLCEDFDAMLSDGEAATFEILQIKEKLGSLRVHFFQRPPMSQELFERLAERRRAAADESERTSQD